jgi:hypothetical protein
LDTPSLYEWGLAGISALTSFILKSASDDRKEMKQDIENNRRELQTHMVSSAKEYLTHADLSDIKNTLQRIEDKIDQKQDKP